MWKTFDNRFWWPEWTNTKWGHRWGKSNEKTKLDDEKENENKSKARKKWNENEANDGNEANVNEAGDDNNENKNKTRGVKW